MDASLEEHDFMVDYLDPSPGFREFHLGVFLRTKLRGEPNTWSNEERMRIWDVKFVPYKGRVFQVSALLDFYKLKQQNPGIEKEIFEEEPFDFPSLEKVLEYC